MKSFINLLLIAGLLATAGASAQSTQPGMGAVLVPGGGVSFRVWAPNAEAVNIRGAFNNWSLDTPLVSEGSSGMWSRIVANAHAGDEYKFFITNTHATSPNPTTEWRRDPYSRDLDYFSATDANSVVYDPSGYAWQTAPGFQAPARRDLVVYELHIGSFNAPTGVPATFSQAIGRLDHIRGLGANAVEVLPVQESPAGSGWGYDSLLPFAIEEDIGGANGFKPFVDACHARGLAVLVDVVYNHAYRNGNDMWEFDLWGTGDGGGIWFFNDAASRDSPWGPRLDFSKTPVRQYLLDNVRMYQGEFRVDGFRFDATGFMRYGNKGSIPGAATLLQAINTQIHSDNPTAVSIAEDFDADHLASKPIASGGLGFDAEWDRFSETGARLLSATDGARDLGDLESALKRKLNSATMNRVVYVESHDTAATEDPPFLVLPYRGGYLPRRINGNDPDTNLVTRKLAQLGSVLTFTAPGVPMLFMGQEFYEIGTFNFPSPPALDWTQGLSAHTGIVRLHHDLIALRKNDAGFSAGLRGDGILVHHRNDAAKVIAYVRTDSNSTPDEGSEVVVALNLSATDFTLGYQIGVPRTGKWQVRFNSDRTIYDPAFSTPYGDATEVTSESVQTDGLPARINIPRLAPYSALILSQGPATRGIAWLAR